MARRSHRSSARRTGGGRSRPQTMGALVAAILALLGVGAVTLGGVKLPFLSPAAQIAPLATAAPGGQSPGGTSAPLANPGGALPANAAKPDPPHTTYQGCPAEGDGGDKELNIRKNRTDSASWYPVSIGSILALKWPPTIERKPHASWSAADKAAIARYEGIPVQVVGWLAGAKAEGPESPNCHSPADVDNHLWIVDAPNKDRTQSVVIEVTPRVRAQHTGWTIQQIQALVTSQTKIRISGWLLMDEEHPDQVGKTRGTIWEIHPIIGFEVQKNGQW